MSEFYEGLAEILEVEPDQINAGFALDDSNWDSLAIVSTIALIDEVYDRSVNADALADCRTVGDIDHLVGADRTSTAA